MTIVRYEEDQLNETVQDAIVSLLEACFPNVFEGRTYFKQLPSFRHLAWREERLLGQIAIDHRVVRLGEVPTRIFGIVDLCVQEPFRRRGIGAKLVQEVEQRAINFGAEFIILFADDHRLYKKIGFRRASNICKWLAIDTHKTLGVQNESLADCLMIRQLSNRQWDDNAPLDMLGHVF